MQHKNLHDGRCPLCGNKIGLPDALYVDTGKFYDIRLTFTDTEGEIAIQDIAGVPEAYYNKLRYAHTGVHNLEILKEIIH
jgi:hypothetical protein